MTVGVIEAWHHSLREAGGLDQGKTWITGHASSSFCVVGVAVRIDRLADPIHIHIVSERTVEALA
jgi:hypothetical protein